MLKKPSFVQDSFISTTYSFDFFYNLNNNLSFDFFTKDFNFSLSNRKNSFIGFTRFFFDNLLYTLNFDGSFFQRFFSFFNFYFINFEFTNFFLQQNLTKTLNNVDNSYLFFFKEPVFSFFFVGLDFFFSIFSDIFHWDLRKPSVLAFSAKYFSVVESFITKAVSFVQDFFYYVNKSWSS